MKLLKMVSQTLLVFFIVSMRNLWWQCSIGEKKYKPKNNIYCGLLDLFSILSTLVVYFPITEYIHLVFELLEELLNAHRFQAVHSFFNLVTTFYFILQACLHLSSLADPIPYVASIYLTSCGHIHRLRLYCWHFLSNYMYLGMVLMTFLQWL